MMRTETTAASGADKTFYRCTHCLMCRSPKITLALPLAASAIGKLEREEHLEAPQAPAHGSLSP